MLFWMASNFCHAIGARWCGVDTDIYTIDNCWLSLVVALRIVSAGWWVGSLGWLCCVGWLLGCAGSCDAKEELLIRNVMAVEEVEYDKAKLGVIEIKNDNTVRVPCDPPTRPSRLLPYTQTVVSFVHVS
jgi:hypothetical protein